MTLLPGADGTPAADDYFPGMLRPSTVADIFDVERFPGSRALRRTPRVNLAWALLADGVPESGIYAALDTDAGLDRAFAKLDTIRDSIVWWDGGEEPFEKRVGEVFRFSLHAGVAARADERNKPERLCCYISRPAVSERRLSLTRNGNVRYRLKTPYRGGTTHVMFGPRDLIARLPPCRAAPQTGLFD